MLREPDGTERQLSPWSQTRSLLPTKALPARSRSSVSALTQEATPLWLWSLRSSPTSRRRSSPIARAPTSGRQMSPNGRWLAQCSRDRANPVPRKSCVARADSMPDHGVGPTRCRSLRIATSHAGHLMAASYFLTNRGGFWNLAGIRFRSQTVASPWVSPSTLRTPVRRG